LGQLPATWQPPLALLLPMTTVLAVARDLVSAWEVALPVSLLPLPVTLLEATEVLLLSAWALLLPVSLLPLPVTLLKATDVLPLSAWALLLPELEFEPEPVPTAAAVLPPLLLALEVEPGSRFTLIALLEPSAEQLAEPSPMGPVLTPPAAAQMPMPSAGPATAKDEAPTRARMAIIRVSRRISGPRSSGAWAVPGQGDLAILSCSNGPCP
jgi:hypothetical protein